MALQVTKKEGFEIFPTGVKLDSAYLRIEVKNNIYGKEKASAKAFASKEHYTNSKNQKLAQFGNIAIAVSGFKLAAVETADLAAAHEQFKAQFEAQGYQVNIVELE